MSNPTIAVVDYGMGNLRSVAHALEHVAGAVRVRVTADAETLANAGRVVFPGQGAARDCMRALRAQGLAEAVEVAYRNKPFLGICMGLQVLFERSEENAGVDCLGLIPGVVRAFDRGGRDPQSGARLAVPQMGWNQVWRAGTEHPLWEGIDEGARFYFAIAITSIHATLRWWRGAVTTATALPARWLATMCSPASSIRKKAQPTV